MNKYVGMTGTELRDRLRKLASVIESDPEWFVVIEDDSELVDLLLAAATKLDEEFG